MTDDELAFWLGVNGQDYCADIITGIDPEKRATYEHMYEVYVQLLLWKAGAARKPNGVIVCDESDCHSH